MKKIESKIMLPVYIMSILFVIFMVIQIGLVTDNLKQVREMKDVSFNTSLKSAELKLNVVQVQQFLTDISATRARDGYNDGFEKAEEHAANVRTLVSELKELNPKEQSSLDDILSTFEPYYETGQQMADAYIKKGPAGGNLIMEDFDSTAVAINSKVDKFMESADAKIIRDIGALEASIRISIILAIVAVIVATVICFIIRTRIVRTVVKPIKEIGKAAKDLAAGNLNAQLVFTSADEVGQMAEDMRQTISVMNTYISDIIYCTEQVGDGNLTVKPSADFQGDFVRIKDSLLQLTDALNETMIQIDQSASQVSAGSEQVAGGSQELSQTSVQQSQSVEELSETINRITQQVSDNAQSALDANNKTTFVGQEATLSTERMQQMLDAMNEINRSSDEISKVIKTIEDIAFQTNILALNAAVEAARAGSAGKGFAVVADEVRNLAAKSAEASKNTAVMIESSIAAVKNGSEIANETARSLSEVADGVKEVEGTIQKISVASTDQSHSLSEITNVVEQISGVVQTTSSTAEESAAASEELSGQAQLLKDLIKHFQITTK